MGRGRGAGARVFAQRCLLSRCIAAGSAEGSAEGSASAPGNAGNARGPRGATTGRGPVCDCELLVVVSASSGVASSAASGHGLPF